MTDFTVYSVPGSPFGRSVLMALEEKGVSWHLLPTSPRDPAHLARHPFARVPVLEHDGFSLYETQAILRYLDRILPEPALTPADPRAAARMDQAMNISDWYLFQGVGNVIAFQRVVAPRLMGLTPDEDACAAAVPRARTVFAELAHILGDQRFFAGETLSLADIQLAPQIDFLMMTPEGQSIVAGHPGLTIWLDRMSARPSMLATTWEKLTG
jgi:glutathione S-transferase